MNEEQAHLTSTGDEATEARIIAWVLGEASAFEAAELEALCEQMPEWRVFHRRMLALHDCLKEAHEVEASAEWKLSAEKRGKLDELIGSVPVSIVKRKNQHSRKWLNALAVAAVLALGFVLYHGATATMGKVGHDVVMQTKERPHVVTYSAEMAPMDSASSVAAGSVAKAQPEELRAKPMRDDMRRAPSSPSTASAKTMAAASSAPAAVPVPTVDGKNSAVAFGTGDELGEGWGAQEAGVVSGAYQQGRLEAAEKAYDQVLRENPYDQEARKGMEQVAAQKADSYSAAYDQTRAELLMEVDKSWEGVVPAERKSLDGRSENEELTQMRDDATIAGKMEFQRSSVADASDAVAKVSEESVRDQKADSIDKDVVLKKLQKQKELQLQPKPQPAMNPAALTLARTLPELWTRDEPYSTFSLRVSDNAFRIAQAAMAQNQRPPAESVRVEEFYNAFDYGDPIPTAQEPVTASMEQSAHPVLPQRNLLRIALRTASVGRSAGQPLSLTLLVDQSGSMNRGDRRAALLASVQELSQMLQAQDQISVIGFSRTPRLLAEKIPGNQTQRLLEIIRTVPSDGGTNLEEALKLGEVVAKRNQLPNAQNRLLLLTDGAANLGNADPGRLSEWVKQLRQKNLSFDIAGIGTDGLNDPLLLEIARHGNGRYYVMNDAAQAKQQFATQLAGAFRPVAENVKVQVQFNPQRVSRYQLIGFEKDRLRTEDFRNDKVDAAEMAAAEAGQALYQIELLPEGSGDIGEVSVRFRDVATQQMVERKWTIRHDATTPVFDRATPTMQLAGLAMLSAQKLQGGDFAPMIRFTEMQEPRRRVRETFSQSQRVSELLQMIDQFQD